MLTADTIELRRSEIASSPDLRALLDRLVARARPLIDRMPSVPDTKALLTSDGGVCPDDGSRLRFDPWSPSDHRCPRCGNSFRGERHDAAWAHYQHLWLAERAAQLATVAVLADNVEAGQRAEELLLVYRGYPEFPNQDNVLGPSRLFFSTYLESIWLANYLAAATLLREAGSLGEGAVEVVSAVADESAGLIGEFDEGLSNRQTWHNAALAAVAVWFEDEELATRAIEGPSGMLAHLLRGFGPDGMWFEGDNYHLFALRGQLLAMGWAQQAGVDLLADSQLAARLAAALRAPALTALPDFTFPARKDSRFGVSLAQPMYLELWEVGLARLDQRAEPPLELWEWLARLYRSAAPPAETFDSYLQEAGEPPPQKPRTRADLSWWSLMEMLPSPPEAAPPWSATSVYLAGQGLAILRSGDRYVAVECGGLGGGHGHADRLNLILHANGEYWLPDLGTGSYVTRDLFWYRSTLAHNAPRLDGVSQPRADAACENFEEAGEWAWVRGRFGNLSRSIIAGPAYVLDVVELSGADDHLLELPLHLMGNVEIEPAGEWGPASLPDEFVRQVERMVTETPDAVTLRSCAGSGATLMVHRSWPGELLRALAPGVPGSREPQRFYLGRGRGKSLRLVTVLEPTRETRECGVCSSATPPLSWTPQKEASGIWPRQKAGRSEPPRALVRLRGEQPVARPFQPLVQLDRPDKARAMAVQLAEAPDLDGTLGGFDLSEPLELDYEDQYRRSEEPYPGPEEFSGRAYVNWDHSALYLGVEVMKPDVVARDPEAPPLRLDNEPDEIHCDGLQLYLRFSQDEVV